MTEEELIRHFPRLWHMAEDGSFESIKAHGLLSTTALLDLYSKAGEERTALESQRRPDSVAISKEGLPNAIVRDQKPMTESALKRCLPEDVTPKEWFEILNDRAFFWLSRERLRGLLAARAYRGRPQTVLTVDTAGLLKSNGARVELSPLNSGATIYNPQPRGRETFLPIADYPFDERRKTRSVEKSVVELVVRGGVPDIADHLIAAHRVHSGAQQELWRRPGTSADDGP
ncbi:MAG: hypothetical protein JWP25_325 [Bradyrhizobium sp.]|nr:hypothetical protein [Bradyrhizobium sp.]